ncbi:hypothetical protein LTS10_012603 [Elasticomyces elasticus]|nr:hypothetical protein LTS10_012603 [Elasticomyces elasticus]
MWLTIPELRHVVLVTCGLLLSNHAAAQSVCIAEFGQETVYEQAISINTYVQTNTTFYPAPHYAVTVSNAPTSFDGITTFRYTESRTLADTSITTRSTASLVATPTVAINAYVLMVQRDPGRQTDRRKIHQRQSGTFYVAANGTMSNDCTLSPIYAVNNGVLTTTVQGTVYTYSTSPGVTFEMFAPSTIPGPITTTFTLGAGGVLVWTNAEFYNGQAAFCSLANGTIYAVFQQHAQPEGCLYIQLTLFTVSSCQGLSYSTVTGPPGVGLRDIMISKGLTLTYGSLLEVLVRKVPPDLSGTLAPRVRAGRLVASVLLEVPACKVHRESKVFLAYQALLEQRRAYLEQMVDKVVWSERRRWGRPVRSKAMSDLYNVSVTDVDAEEFKVSPEALVRQKGATGQQGIPGSTGLQGVQGISGAVGQSYAFVLAHWSTSSCSAERHRYELIRVKPTGLSGAVGATGISGAVGQPGPTGAQGPTGMQGVIGPTGQQGNQGIPGISGAVGATGSTGPSGPTGATGVPGASATSFMYGYLGCYVQVGGKTSSTGLALPSFQATYSTLVDSSCSQVCASKNFIFFGTVNTAATTADCWCGNNIAYVTSNAGLLGAGVVSGEVGENNCYPCIGAAAPGGVVGNCGNSTLMTMAIFARNF